MLIFQVLTFAASLLHAQQITISVELTNIAYEYMTHKQIPLDNTLVSSLEWLMGSLTILGKACWGENSLLGKYFTFYQTRC